MSRAGASERVQSIALGTVSGRIETDRAGSGLCDPTGSRVFVSGSPYAGVAELADAQDLKTDRDHRVVLGRTGM